MMGMQQGYNMMGYLSSGKWSELLGAMVVSMYIITFESRSQSVIKSVPTCPNHVIEARKVQMGYYEYWGG